MALPACGDSSDEPGRAAPRIAPPAATGKLPRDFVGLVSEHAYAAQGTERDRLLARHAAAGVRLLRQTFDWSRIETAPGRFDFTAYDGFVTAAARHGITILPILFAPPWFHSTAPGRLPPGSPTYPPKTASAMARFATALIGRYGPEGSLWDRSGSVRLPIRTWQVWNEPNLPAYWGEKPEAREYAELLRVVHGAIKRADKEAQVVTGGIPNSKLGIPFEDYVRALFRAGAKGSFDALAIHPYARTEEGVVLAIASARRLLDSLGARDTDLWVTEFGWASGGPGSAFTVSEEVQARYVGDAIADFARRRNDFRLRGFVYFNWRDAPPYAGGKDFWGLHTGLERIDGTPKPARRAFAAAVKELR